VSRKVIGNRAIREAIHDFLLVFHCKYVWLYLALFPRYYQLFHAIRAVSITQPCYSAYSSSTV